MSLSKKYKIERVSLLSGGELLNIFIPNMPFSIVSIWTDTGSRHDPKNKEGLSHFFEHLMAMQTKKYPNRLKRLQVLESKGIFSNAFTTRDCTYYYHIQMPKQTYDSLELLIDGFNNPIFKNTDIAEEKNVILDEYFRVKNDPNSYVEHLNIQSLYPKSKLGRNFFGSQKTIKSINLTDIQNFKNKYYTLSNSIFVVIGNESTAKLKKIIEKNHNHKIKIENSNNKIFFTKPTIKISNQNIHAITIGVNYRTVSISDLKNTTILNLIAEYLANNWTSKLIEKLRIKNSITYWVNAETGYFKDTGYLSINFSIQKENLKKTLNIIFDEVDKIKNKKISNLELNIFKTICKSSLIRKFSDPYEFLWWYGHPALLKSKILSPDEYIKMLDKITPTDIMVAANKFLIKENLGLALIGPVEKKEISI